MIQLGPLKLPDALTAVVGIKEGRYKRLSSGEEMIIQAPKNTMRFNFRMENYKTPELLELLRNNQVQSMPLYSGHEYLSGNYALQTLRESPISAYYSDFELVLEKTSDYVKKLQDIMVRQDDWTVLVNEDFDSGANIGDSILPKFESLHDAGTHTNLVATDDGIQAMSGTRVWKIEPTGYKGIAIFGTHWRNYHYSAWVQCNDAFDHGIIWRAEEGNIEGWTDSWTKTAANYANRGRHYRLVVDTTNNAYVIEYHSAWGSGDSPEVIWTQSESELGLNIWYHLAVICVGDTHYCFVNGQLIHYFEDTRAKGGAIGVILDSTASGDYLYVDDILVHEIPYVPLVLDESHTEPSTEPLKTRETPRGTIGYYEHPDVSYKMNQGGNNCVLHLRFDQPYGNKVFDLSGNNNHADVIGANWSNAGFMSFDRSKLTGTTDGTFIRIPSSSELNTDAEGTLIIRMKNRVPYGAGGFGQKIISKGNGAWYLSISFATDLNFCIDEDGPCSASAIHSPTGEFSQEFKTYVVRWKKSTANMNMYKNGRLIGAPATTSWTTDGQETTDPILIGNANVDIEYVLLYDRYLEFPDLPDSFGVRLMDVDTHDEHEIFDVRWCDPIALVKEYWSDVAWTNNGSEHLDDLTRDQNPSLLYRRGGLALIDATDYVYADLSSYISDSLDSANFTIELVLSHNTITTTQSTAYDILSVCDSTGATQTIGLSLYRGPTGPTYLRVTVKTSGGTETHDLFTIGRSGAGFVNISGSIIQVVLKASDLSLTGYYNGKLAGSARLSNAIDGTDLARLYLGKRNASGTGCEDVILYRARIIATALNKQEIKEIYHEYEKSPIQVFGEHEFEGYPELNNGLLSVRPTGNYADNEIGERPLFEIYNNGSYLVPSGDSGGDTEPMELRHAIDDETNTYLIRSFEAKPIVRSVSQDHVEIEFRNQVQRRDQYLAAQGSYTRQRMELALGMFAVDTEIQINTRTTNWELYLVHNDMQVLWQEGSYVKYQGDGDEAWQTFISCNGPGAAAKTLDIEPSKPYFASYTVLANWANHDYALGIMLSSMDDHMQVEIAAGDAVLKDDVYFKNIQGSKLRVVMGVIPVIKENIYKTENDWSKVNFTIQTSQSEFIDDNNLIGDQSGDPARVYKWFSFEPGVYRLFFNFVFTESTNFLMSATDPNGFYRALRKQYMGVGYVKPEQMWFDLDLVVNAITAENLTMKLALRAADNTSSDITEFDGLIILPLWNGADFILDQLYLARQLKLVRRYS